MLYDTYYNGIYTNFDELKLPLTDRSIFFGDGIYDAALCGGGKIFMLDEHIERFISNAKLLNIPLPAEKKQICDVLYSLTPKTAHGTYFLYFQLTRYSARRAHSYDDTSKSNFLVTVSEISLSAPTYTIKLISVPDIRYEMCNIKTLNLLPSVLASKRAAVLGADEAVFCRGDTVTECSHSNIHIIKNGKLKTHPLNARILPGISRKHLLMTANRIGIATDETAFTLDEMKDADEVIVTSTSKLALRASEVDGIKYNTENNTVGAELCRLMRADFDAFVE